MSSSTRSRAPLVALVLATSLEALAKSGAIGDSDGWWHFRTGELILRRHAVPHHDPFSWTAGGAPWHPNAWLSDVVFALVRRVGGLPAIAVGRGLFVIAFAFALYGLARSSSGRPWPASIAAIAGTFAITPFVAERPQLFSFVLLPAVLVIARAALQGSRRALVGLVALVVLWANLHGVYVTGIAVVGAMSVGAVLDGRSFDLRSLARPALVAFAVAVAGLVNPFGAGSYTYAAHVRSVSGPIQEWRHFHVGDPRDQIVALLALLAVAAMVRTGRVRHWAVVLPVVLLAVATADAIRNAPLLVVVSSTELALGAGTFRAPRARTFLRPRAGPIGMGLTVAWVVLAAGGVRNATHAGDVRATDFPVHAVAAIPNGCRLLNEYDQGGYVIDRRSPAVLVSQDGRNDLYGLRGENRILAQSRVLKGRPAAMAWLDRHHVDCVLAHRNRPLVAQLRRRPDWRVVATDASGVLLVRGTR